MKYQKKSSPAETRQEDDCDVPTFPELPSIESTSDEDEWRLLEHYTNSQIGGDEGMGGSIYNIRDDEMAPVQSEMQPVDAGPDAMPRLPEPPTVDLLDDIAGYPDFN